MKEHPVATGAIVCTTSLVCALEAIGWPQNPTKDVPAGSCISPGAISETYVDVGMNAAQVGAGMFVTGVSAKGHLPPGASGIRASFKAPLEPEQAWEEHASDMVPLDKLGNFGVKLAVGGEEVKFRIDGLAPLGSLACNQAPDVKFTRLDVTDYFLDNDQLPYPNFINVPIAVFGIK